MTITIFATQSGSIPLSELDSNFTTPITIGSTAIALGQTATTLAGVTLASSCVFPIIPISSGGTGTATPSLVAGTNVTITGTWPNQTINSTGGGSGIYLPLTGGTLTGNLTIDGTNALRGSYGAGGVPTNFTAGDGALFRNTTGLNNAAIGYISLSYNTTGSYNSAMGAQALTLNTNGTDNAAIGYQALYTNTSGSANSAVGSNALKSNTTGIGNSAIGYGALQTSTTSSRNSAVGFSALGSNTIGDYNVAVGASALYSNTTGASNSAVGSNALYSNTTGGYNVAVGYGALQTSVTAVSNVAIGYQALYTTTGSDNSAIGYQVLKLNTSGASNSVIGANALSNNTSGSGNSAIGYNILSANTQGQGNSAIGQSALLSNTTGNYNSAIGYLSLGNNTTGSGNSSLNPTTSTGLNSPVFNVTTENNRFCMGSTAVTNAYIQVAWTVVSDARDKTNFAPVPHGLDFVNQLNPTAYQYKEDRETDVPTGIVRYGFKAQDILALEGDTPVIIDTEDLDKLRFNSDSLIPVLVNAIKELTARLEALESKNV